MKKRTAQISSRGTRKLRTTTAERQCCAVPQLVQIEKPIYGGAFLARVEGKAVFVPLALPGEQARVRMVEEKRGYATAEVEEIVAAAPERVAPACRHFGACGGCQYQHAEYAAQLAYQAGDSARDAGARRRARAGRDCSAGRRAVGVPESHPAGVRCGGKPATAGGGRMRWFRLTSARLPRRCWCGLRSAPRNCSGGLRVPSRPAELSLFCDAAEDSMLASVFTEWRGSGSAQGLFRCAVVADSFASRRGAGGSSPRPAKDRRAGWRRVNCTTVRRI